MRVLIPIKQIDIGELREMTTPNHTRRDDPDFGYWEVYPDDDGRIVISLPSEIRLTHSQAIDLIAALAIAIRDEQQ